MGGRLTLEAPAYWGSAGGGPTDSLPEMLFCIPNPVSEGAGIAANVVVRAHHAHLPVNLKAASDSQLAKVSARLPVIVLLDSLFEGKLRIVARRGQEGEVTYNLNDIYVVSGDVLVSCFIALPNMTSIPNDWYSRVIHELNQLLRSLRLDGQPVLPTDIYIGLLPR